MISPIDASGLSSVDLAMRLVVAVAMFPASRSRGVMSRVEGAILLASYVSYTVWLISQVK